jgi:hypothetical protein
MHARASAILLLAAVLGGCSAAPTDAPTPIATVADVRLHPVARAILAEFDPGDLVSRQSGGAACRSHPMGTDQVGGGIRMLTTIRCPHEAGDRTIAFLLADAIQPELERLGVALREGGGTREADNPADVVLSWSWGGTSPGLGVTAQEVVVDAGAELVIVVTTDLAPE